MKIKLTQDYLTDKAGTVVDVAQDTAALLVKAGYAEPPTPESIAAGAMESAMTKAMDPLSAKLTEVVNALKGSKGSAPPPVDTTAGNFGFKTMGEQLTAVFAATRKGGVVDSRLRDTGSHGKFALDSDGHIKLTAGHAGESVDSAGGFLVPEQFIADLRTLGMPMSVVRPRAQVIPIQGDTISFPRVEDADMSSSLFGGVTAYWLGEGVTAVPTRPKYGKVALKAKSLVGYTLASNQLLADSAIGLETFLKNCFSKAIAFQEDEAFYIGNGADRPHGWTLSPAVYGVARETDDKILIEDLANMFARMYPFSMPNAVWVAHPSILPQLINMKNADGDNANYVWIGSDRGLTATPPITILGRPLIWSMHNTTLGNTNDIAFVDFSNYIIADRQQITIDASTEVAFETRETAWLFEERVDGAVWLASTIKDRQGYESSPFVVLNHHV